MFIHYTTNTLTHDQHKSHASSNVEWLIYIYTYDIYIILYTSTSVKSFGLVESRLDVAFTMGLDARWQYNCGRVTFCKPG